MVAWIAPDSPCEEMTMDAEFDHPLEHDHWLDERPRFVAIPVHCDDCGKYMGIQIFDMTNDRPEFICTNCLL